FASAAFQLESTFGNRFGLRRDQFHKRRRTRLPADLSRGSHAPFQIVPRHMQLPGGPINPFLPGHLNSSRPKLSGYPGFPAAMVSPFFETSSCFFQADNRGLATCHGLPPRRGHRRQNDLNSYLAVISCRLAGNSQMNRSLVFDLATCGFIAKREDALFLGPGGTGKSHLAQAIGQSAILQGYRVYYREAHVLLDELADAAADGKRKQYLESLAAVPLLIIDDFGMRKLPLTAAEDLLEIVMRRYERAS